MILAIDIENTRISIGCAVAEGIRFIERISTNLERTDLEYAVSIRTILELNHVKASELEGSIVCSVVPQLNHTIREAIRKATGLEKILTVGPGVRTGLNIQIDDPAKLGSDLAVNAVAAIAEYPLPLVVMNLGACTTFSVINEKGAYIGGSILPGIQTSMDAMIQNAAQLPYVSLDEPGRLIGKNTQECIRSGYRYGNAAMIDGMLDLIAKELTAEPTVVATGDMAPSILPYCRHTICMDEGLLLKGLAIIYRKNAGTEKAGRK